MWWFRLQTDGLLPEFYLSPPSSKVITGRACIIQWKSGFRLLSDESGLMCLMSLPHHFSHRSLRTVSQRWVRCCKHPTVAVISFFYICSINFVICGQMQSISAKFKISDSLNILKITMALFKVAKWFLPNQDLATPSPNLIMGSPPPLLTTVKLICLTWCRKSNIPASYWSVPLERKRKRGLFNIDKLYRV